MRDDIFCTPPTRFPAARPRMRPPSAAFLPPSNRRLETPPADGTPPAADGPLCPRLLSPTCRRPSDFEFSSECGRPPASRWSDGWVGCTTLPALVAYSNDTMTPARSLLLTWSGAIDFLKRAFVRRGEEEAAGSVQILNYFNQSNYTIEF